MDKLLVAAQYYKENLCGRTFRLEAGKRGSITTLTVQFDENHFKHLAGLHKLNDMPEVKKRSSAALYKAILNEKLSLSDIENCENYYDVKNRLDCFPQMRDVLSKSDLMVKNKGGSFGRIAADYLMAKNQEGEGQVALFLKDTEDKITIPCTFFSDVPDYYIKNSIRLTVIKCDEITQSVEQSATNDIAFRKENQTDLRQEVASDVDLKTTLSPQDVVAETIDQCGAKLDAEIKQEQIHKTQEKANQQVQQVEQVQQVRQVGRNRGGAQKVKTANNRGKR